MTSKGEAALTFKGFGSNLVPSEVSGPAVNLQLKKRAEDFVFTLGLTDATLKDPRAGKGLVLSAERKLGSEWPGRGGAVCGHRGSRCGWAARRGNSPR